MTCQISGGYEGAFLRRHLLHQSERRWWNDVSFRIAENFRSIGKHNCWAWLYIFAVPKDKENQGKKKRPFAQRSLITLRKRA